MLRFLVFLLAAFALKAQTRELNLASFEAVWSTVRDTHWEDKPGGLDWQAIHEEYRPRIEAANSLEESRKVMRDMLARLKQTHFAILPGSAYGDSSADEPADGCPGFTTRLIDGKAIVNESRAQDVRPGMEVVRADQYDVRGLASLLVADDSIPDLSKQRALEQKLTGTRRTRKRYLLENMDGTRLEADVLLSMPPGVASSFGNLPPQYVVFEEKRLGQTGYIRFNLFLDLARVMNQFGEAVTACKSCDGLIIDLRGNPGGIGAMAMGMGGWLVDKPGLRLGTMYMKGATLNFVLNPRPGAFLGPVAILVDSTSASTSEILAGGLQDLHRARVFGTQTAGAALPSAITKLLNGDGFQYALANYISQGGKALEGNGVTPDEQVHLTRESLAAGHDLVIDAALEWIRKEATKKGAGHVQ